MNLDLNEICRLIPKCELHIHIEGTIEPELLLELSKRNNIQIPYNTLEEIREKYNFKNLGEFIDLFIAYSKVLRKEPDFYDLMYAYLKKANSQHIKYAEIFVDHVLYQTNDVEFSVFMSGYIKAIEQAEKDFGIKAKLILCFKRDSPVELAREALKLSLPYKSHIIAVGLASNERGYPPELFSEVFEEARKCGYRLCAHAGEECGPENIQKCLEMGIERIDHGVKIIDDEKLMDIFAEKQIPLTNCPLSNYRLQVYPDLKKFPLKTFIKKGLLVMLNSDDPAFFGGYLTENYISMVDNCQINFDEIVLLAKNSFKASFLSSEEKNFFLNSIDDFAKNALINSN
jgi:adenosine deaminase